MTKQRIAYIDFIKGLCIILIVAFHTKPLAWGEHSYKLLLSLPVFFLISGCFFKPQDNFLEFLRRKVNTLIVPMIFFLFIGFVYFVARELVFSRFNIAAVIHKLPTNIFDLNTPMWFLLVLFEVNLLYYFLRKLLSPPWAIAPALAIGVAGYYLASTNTRLFLLIDITMVALPFFAVGCLLKNCSLLDKSPKLIYSLLCLAIALGIVFFADCGLNMYKRAYPSIFNFFVIPLLLAIPMMWVGHRLVKKDIPLVSFMGKNSLIVLGTHYYLIGPLNAVIKPFLKPLLAYFATIIGTLALEYPVIYLLKKYLPRLTAQEEFFGPGWKV